jgi:hypothetical protein
MFCVGNIYVIKETYGYSDEEYETLSPEQNNQPTKLNTVTAWLVVFFRFPVKRKTFLLLDSERDVSHF